MKTVAVSLVAAVVLLSAWSAKGAPVKGPRSLGLKNSLEDGSFQFKETFRGGERACVIARAASEDDDLVIEVFDAAGRIVAGTANKGDLVAAIWYPPRDAVYDIRISSPEGKSKTCYVAVK